MPSFELVSEKEAQAAKSVEDLLADMDAGTINVFDLVRVPDDRLVAWLQANQVVCRQVWKAEVVPAEFWFQRDSADPYGMHTPTKLVDLHEAVEAVVRRNAVANQLDARWRAGLRVEAATKALESCG